MECPITISSRGESSNQPKSLMYLALMKAREEIMRQEDEEIFKILDTIASKDEF